MGNKYYILAKNYGKGWVKSHGTEWIVIFLPIMLYAICKYDCVDLQIRKP